jgi:7,8-dihydroneopterin aldolase/epimerase/oxygenase
MTDSIEIRGIHCFGYHGVHAEERQLGQRFLIDVLLSLDLRAASSEDDLSRGADYGQVVRRTREIVEGEPSKLIETVAERVAAALLQAFDSVTGVEICVHKPNAPIAGAPVDDIAVRILRQRGE